MVYPGNDALSPEIRKRIQETFRQTLKLAAEGTRQEALLGCDFILRLDPMFEPARALAQRLESPEEVRVDDLREAFEEAFGDAGRSEAAAGETTMNLVPEAPPAVQAAKTNDLLGNLEAALAAPAELKVDDLFDRPEPAASEVQETPPPPPELPSLEPEPAVAAVTAAPEPPKTPDPPPAVEVSSAPEAEAEPEPEPIVENPAENLLGELDVALDSESRKRIRELLDEGQAAFDRMEHQAAIDAWSRIFLIDIEHGEASRRIDLARKLKAELERSVEEAMHEGITHVEQGDLDGARESFEKVLEMVPQHATAQEYLARLDRNESPIPAPPAIEPAPAPTPAPEPSVPAPAAPGEPAAEIEARRPVAQTRTMAASSPQRSRGRLFVYLGIAVLLAVLAGGWFLYSNWSRIFPNATEPVEQVRRDDPITRAQTLYDEGKRSIAIAQLRRLGPDSPAYAEAQALIFQWESGITEESDEPDPAETLAAEREQIVEQARNAYGNGDYFRADELLRQAEALAPFEGIETGFVDLVRERLDPIRSQLEIFQQGEWEIALRDLWRIHENDPRNPVVIQLMVDCYYNLGVRDLQRGDTASAAQKFNEAMALAPGLPDIERLARFANSYREKPPDLLYRIFVKYLPFR